LYILGSAQHLGHGAQNLVAAFPSVAGIDRQEMIQIQKGKRKRLVVGLSLLDGQAEALFEGLARQQVKRRSWSWGAPVRSH
jgi:hypothetical protein